MATRPNPPQPDPSIDSLPWWESVKAGVLAVQRCTSCHQWQFPSLETCRHCGGAVALEPVSGRGTIYSYFLNNRPAVPGLDPEPYPIALVALEEDELVRIPGRVVGAGQVAIGQAVQAEIVDLPGGDWKVPVFRIA